MFPFSNAGINPIATDVVFALVMILLTAAVVVAGVWLLVRFMGKGRNAEPKGHKTVAKLFTLLLLCGIVLRVIFALTVIGYRADYNAIAGAMEYTALNGFKGYYQTNGTGIYPLSLLLYGLLGLPLKALGLTASSYATVIFVKLPLIIADVASAVLIFKLAEKYSNGYIALIISGMFLTAPVFMLGSAIWTSLYPLLTFAVLLCLYFVVNRNFLGLFAAYTAALLIMKDALYLFPLVAVFVTYNFVKSLLKVIKTCPSIKEIWFDKEVCQVIRTPIYFVASYVVAYLVSLLPIINDYGAGFFEPMYRFWLLPLGVASYFGTNSLGIFNIFARNGNALGSNFPTIVFAVIFAAITLGIVLLTYLSKRNRANLVYLAAYVILTLSTYYVDFTALSLLPALAILLMAFVLIRDKRIMQIFGILSLLVVVNATAALIGAGYVNTASSEAFKTGLYTGNPVLSKDGGLAVSIICSVFVVITHLYATLVLLDLSMSGKRVVLESDEKASFVQSMAGWLKP